MSETSNSPLVLPALRVHMGDWIYYISYLRMRDVAARISIAKEIHSSASLRDLLQRQLTDRSSAIKTYLLSQAQRFFNALVVGTYGGSPQWHELAIRTEGSGLDPLPEHIDGVLGILTLEGSEKLFAIDGQHRVAGIRRAVAEQASLGDEEVCIIFVAGVVQEHRDDDPIGFERTRRLFTTLNRYAKPVSKKDIIALDEDDVVAIITRRLVEEYQLFCDKVSIKETKNIPVSDKRSLTTIIALYDALDIYLATGRGWKKFKRFRPPDEEINRFLARSIELWDVLTEYFTALQDLRDSEPAQEVASQYRHNQGGHLLFRPVGLLLAVQVIRHLVDSQVSLPEAVDRISRVPTDIAGEPWVGLLWDATNQRMITSPENQRAAKGLFFYAVGGDLAKLRTDTEKLRRDLAGRLNKAVEEVELPRYL